MLLSTHYFSCVNAAGPVVLVNVVIGFTIASAAVATIDGHRVLLHVLNSQCYLNALSGQP